MRILIYSLFVYLGAFFSPLLTLHAQFETVEFDYQRAYFNNGQPLPAETYMMITGEAQSNVELVEVKLYRSKANRKKPPLYQTDWKRVSRDEERIFRAPFHYRLAGNTDYDVQVSFYRAVTTGEKKLLRMRLFESLDAYLAQNLEIKNEKIKVLSASASMVSDLNTLVREGLSNYRSRNFEGFVGFSDLIKDGLKNVDNMNLDMAPGLAGGQVDLDTGASAMPLPTDWYQRPLHALHKTIHVEIDNYLNSDLLVMIDNRIVSGYPTEKTRRSLSLNVGYGAVLLARESNKFSYGTSPYVGLSLPMASRSSASRFLTNTAFSLGVFTQNFKDEDDNKISGPIFGIPVYAGLGYRFFRFIRVNGGITVLENEDSGTGVGSGSLSIGEIQIKPFLGISAEIDLWLGFSEKR